MTTIPQLEQAISALTRYQTDAAPLKAQTLQQILSALESQLARLKKQQFSTERRQVTIMFADISGFTAMSEKLDPEEVRSMINACFEKLVAVIKRYDGYIDKFIGDEIMALFGAPVAHENDPERALRAALDMMSALDEFNIQYADKIPKPLALHFGINTGLVISGGIGSADRQDYSVMGDAVNLASRLEGLSEAGEILVGETTYRLTAPMFEFDPLQPVKVKGKEKPINVYNLLKAKAVQAGQIRGIEGLSSPLVGREDDFVQLEKAYAKLSSAKGSLICLIGEAGLGKTRLISELRAAHFDDQTIWARGQALSYGEHASYLLARTLFKSLLGVNADAGINEVGQALEDDIRRLFPNDFREVFPYLAWLLELPLTDRMAQRVKYLEGEALHRRIAQACQTYLAAKSSQTPLVLICDDLHWADPSSLALLGSFLPLIQEYPIIISLLYRPLRQSRIWAFHKEVFKNEPTDYLTINLEPLNQKQSCQLVQNLLSPCNLPANIPQMITAKAEGNPFYIEEVIRSLIDAGTLRRNEAGAWLVAADIEAITIPDTLQGVVMSRIDHLDVESKRILQVAAVIGRNFPYQLLSNLVENNNFQDASYG